MKRSMLCMISLLLCLALLAGCGGKTETPVETQPETIQQTEAPTQAPTTEPQPVFEKQTVMLLVQEYLQNYEGGNFLKGYTYDEYGRATEYFLINGDGSRGWVTEYSYDENGNRTESRTGDSVTRMTYDEDGKLLSEISTYKEEPRSETYYEYDDQGYVIAETRIERYDGEVTYTFDIHYNEDHTEAQIDQFKNGEPNGTTRETYDAAGRVLTSAVYDANGNWKRSQSWTYDEEGKLVQEANYSRSETQADYNTIYTYDENGLLLSKNVDYYYGYLLEYTYEPIEILVRVK